MPVYHTPDGRYTIAIETPGEGDGNTVVYDRGKVVWDRFSYEASLGVSPPDPSIPPKLPIPVPSQVGTLLIERNVNPIGMSYWRNINQHRGQQLLQAFLSINDEIVIFTIDKMSFQVLGARRLGIHHTGEGCYFSAINPEMLFVQLDDALIKMNINTTQRETVWRMKGSDRIWQCHSSYDERVHSATIRDENYKDIAWGVSIDGIEKRFTIDDNPDECQIDKTGKYLFVRNAEYNRVINVQTESEMIIPRRERLGHGDTGFEIAVGEVDYRAGGIDIIDLNTYERREIFTLGIWNLGYVAAALNREFYLVSTSDNRLIKVNINGDVQFICDLLSQSDKYEYRAKANLCPESEYAIWTAFVDGSLNAYLVRI